jgi:ABC-type sulfate transport system substrate-binding protein
VTAQAEETPVLNPAETERWIRDVKDRIAKGVRVVTEAEKTAKAKRRDFDDAWAYAMKHAEGPEYLRKAEATMATMTQRAQAENAEIAFRYAERLAKALDKELFAAMAVNSNIRSMWVAAGVAE